MLFRSFKKMLKISKLWKDFENSFGGNGISVHNKKLDLDKLLDQEEHVVSTTRGIVHVFCNIEMVDSRIIPIITFHTASDSLALNFTQNRGFVTAQYLSHAIKEEYNRLMEEDKND